jgi:hypothetical protein
MKTTFRLTVLCLMLMSAHAARAAQTSPEALAGTWVYSATEGHSEFQECPDFIDFSADGNYKVDNECAGADPAAPTVETGRWAFERSDTVEFIVFTDRKPLSDHDFLGDNGSSRIRLLELSSKSLRVEMCTVPSAGGACRVEVYRRWAP